MAEYRRPGRLTAAMNTFVRLLTGLGVSPQGAHMLTVRGRSSGKRLSTPVNPLTFEGARYLVAPRGNTQWARNALARGEGELKLGRKTERVRLEAVPEEERPPIIAAYLRRWGNVTREHFGATSNTPGEEELARLAKRTPVFRIAPRGD
jgi:hypothetical protein